MSPHSLWSVIIRMGAAAAIGRIRFKRIGGFCTGSRVEHNLRNDDMAERKPKNPICERMLYRHHCRADSLQQILQFLLIEGGLLSATPFKHCPSGNWAD